MQTSTLNALATKKSTPISSITQGEKSISFELCLVEPIYDEEGSNTISGYNLRIRQPNANRPNSTTLFNKLDKALNETSHLPQTQKLIKAGDKLIKSAKNKQTNSQKRSILPKKLDSRSVEIPRGRVADVAKSINPIKFQYSLEFMEMVMLLPSFKEIFQDLELPNV